MEEKERYEFGQRTLFNNREELTTFDGFNLDDFMQIICKLLNQQDKRIKELEQENLSLQEQSIRDNQNWIEETTQLKQQLKDTEESYNNTMRYLNKTRSELLNLTKQIVEEIREKSIGLWYFVFEEQKEYFEGNRYVLSQKDFDEILATILKKFGEKYE